MTTGEIPGTEIHTIEIYQELLFMASHINLKHTTTPKCSHPFGSHLPTNSTAS